MASIRDVAALAGVSAATVSRVLNNDTTYKIREETRSKVWDATARTGYKQKAAPHSNKAAAAPLDKRIGCILSVTKDKYRDPYFMSIYAGVEARLMEKGYSIAFLKTYYEVQEPETLRAFLEAPPAGIILMEQLSPSLYRSLRARIPACVGIDTRTPDIDIVGYDHFDAGMHLANHLIKKGHQKIAFFCQFTCIFHVIQYPLNTTGRKIRIDKQSGLSLYQFAVSLIFQFFANSRSPLALPYHGMINGLAGMSVPNNHRFALIGDGKRIRNILSIHFFLFKQTMYRFYGIFIDFFGIMLYPSYLRVELLMFYIYPMQQFAIFREQHGFCCRSTLIYGNYSANHTIRFKKDMFIFSRIQGQSCRCPLYPIRNGQRFHGSFHEPRSHRGCR